MAFEVLNRLPPGALRAARIAIPGALLVLAARWGFHVMNERAADRAAAATARAEAIALEEAQSKSAQLRDQRARALTRLESLRSQVNAQWLKDVEAAHAFGAMGVVP